MMEFLKARLTQELNIFDRQYCEYGELLHTWHIYLL